MDTDERPAEGSSVQEQGSSHSSQQDESKEHGKFNLNDCYLDLFMKSWREITSDNRHTLFGFRRYRTIHLLNLRLLEAEIGTIDHDIYQAGLQLDQPLGREHILDRLGLKHAKIDSKRAKVEEVVNKDSILRLRKLIKDYDESLETFNTLMNMETYSLADNVPQSSVRQDIHAYEKFKTRMLRVDLPRRNSSRDPIQHFLRKGLRQCWYALNLWKLRGDEEQGQTGPFSKLMANWDRTYQNTSRIAEAMTRFVMAGVAGAALIVPLVIMSNQNSQDSRLIVVILFVSVFCFLLSLLSKASNYETMAASAAYAAVLTVFVSNGSNP